MKSDPITRRLYQNLREQAQPGAIAGTSSEALASDIEESLADAFYADYVASGTAGYPTDEAGNINYYALAHAVQAIAAAEASAQESTP